ncbi:MAG: alpha/beta fold hydrolase [Bradyrhizobium sp.]|uniref:alpha/beta hydrolase family protein n=1 Tax=Bradyrhizobium sp. TaxID=376 RepID=UPI0025C537E4|nr:alpha/beta fold hydrolase [Bradyrhizobium sp.]MBI5263901.1 alpha/beta fold hydrolase [Bradyrhizobium sp.]
MQAFKALFALLAFGVISCALPCTAARAQPPGAQGDEGEPFRRQLWLVPSPEAGLAANAVLFRPPGDGPFRLALIAHASTQNALRRAQMAQPEYRALAAFLTARGFAVLVPERLGHGSTGGRYAEDQGGCEEADYDRAARATAEQIALALQFLRSQNFIRRDAAVIIGHSAGGWGALALAGEDPKMIAAIVAFAPGRGGHANDFPNQVCAPHALSAAAAAFGKAARVPITWLVASNDTYFSPTLSRQLADAFRGGGKVDFQVLPASGSEGHWMVENETGVRLAGPALERALKLPKPVAAKKP